MRFVVFPRDLDIDRWRHKSHRHVIQHRKSRVVCWYRQVCSFRSACSSRSSSFSSHTQAWLAGLELRRHCRPPWLCDVSWTGCTTSVDCFMNWWWLKFATSNSNCQIYCTCMYAVNSSQARHAYDLLIDCQRCCAKWITVFELLTMIESMEII